MLGDLASLLFPTEVMARFGYYVPGTYVYDGANRIFPAALAQPVAPLMQTCGSPKRISFRTPSAISRRADRCWCADYSGPRV